MIITLQVGANWAAGYNGDGLRAWKNAGGAVTYYLYDGALPVVEINSQGTVSATNTFGANGLVSRNSGGSSVYYSFDPQGSVVQRLDGTGAPLASFLFDAYGVGQAQGSNIGTDPWGYEAQSGYYTDRANASDTGFILLTSRYYDPAKGRFLTRDPDGYAGGINLYGYVRNNPMGLSDPDGTNPLLICALAGAGFGAIFQGGMAYYHGENVARAALHGAVIGGISGLAGCGLGAFFAPFASGILGGALSGATGGAAADALGQWVEIGLGWRKCYDWTQTLASGALGGVIGGAGGWWVSRPAQTLLPTETLMRLVGPKEAIGVADAGELVESSEIPGRGMTRVFMSEDLERMQQGGVFQNRTHLVSVQVRPGWRSLFPQGGAVMARDAWGFIVDVDRINGFKVGEPTVTEISH